MQIRNFAAVPALALALCACGSNRDTPANDTVAATMNETTMNDMATAPAATASPAQTFANAAAASDTFEIETSRLALSTSQSASVKRFAQSMVDAHTQSTAKLKTAASGASITPDPALTAEQTATLADLRGKSGAAFDTAYIEAQRAGHAKTLDTLKGYAASGDAQPLKAFATEMVPIVTAHLNMASGLRP
ncbi:DUF4142 domain-containing protein [Sphingomonas sp. Y38-1Y]|uniref:DUF4142 domain-containing protein n=1 Tax=Sphingomonas sp. Y38-1Y TaxID=3078265 RepID=UPI0028E79D53|nr:DUF4142 domain-containing protein [Sphingomonas sp. Y38-1Y]